MRAAVVEYAERVGITLLSIISDGENEYSGFRELQNLIKLGECGAVLVPSADCLGEDEYTALENELFLKRNGIKLICVRKHGRDHLRGLLFSVKRYYGYDPCWSAEYGETMPERTDTEIFRRRPPFGYDPDKNDARIKPEDAAVVKEIFELYCEGERIAAICDRLNLRFAERDTRFGSGTIRTILGNSHYLGRKSKVGYALQPIIKLEQWFRAQERLEKDYGSERCVLPFCSNVWSDRTVSYLLPGSYIPSFPRAEDNNVNTEMLESELCRVIKAHASPEHADALWEGYALPKKAEAEEAMTRAQSELEKAEARFAAVLEKVKSGLRSADLQEELEKLTDLKNVYAMRVRRIESETELCSLKREDIRKFFARAENMERLSREEKTFMSNAFIIGVRLKNGAADAFVRDAVSGKPTAHRLEDVLIRSRI